MRIRYVPTVSLAVPDKSPRKRDVRTAVVAGEIFPKSDETASQEVVTQLRDDDPNVFAVPVKPAPPSLLLAKSVDRLVVLERLGQRCQGTVRLVTAGRRDRAKPSASLAQWMLSPWGGPDQVVLPGFHTPAETALKRGGTGDEMFLAVCGFMSTGTRTILLSRWRDGGRTSYDLMREFVRELPHRSASDAWQRSVQLAIAIRAGFQSRAARQIAAHRHDPQSRTSVLLERLPAGRYGRGTEVSQDRGRSGLRPCPSSIA